METFTDFLVNNYIWFLIVALVLIFALIGYLVDTKPNKEIIKKEVKPKEEKPLVKEEKSEIEVKKVETKPTENIELKVADEPLEKELQDVVEEPKTEILEFNNPALEETDFNEAFKVDEVAATTFEIDKNSK